TLRGQRYEVVSEEAPTIRDVKRLLAVQHGAPSLQLFYKGMRLPDDQAIADLKLGPLDTLAGIPSRGADTLLPGYLSRPGVSPAKLLRRSVGPGSTASAGHAVSRLREQDQVDGWKGTRGSEALTAMQESLGAARQAEAASGEAGGSIPNPMQASPTLPQIPTDGAGAVVGGVAGSDSEAEGLILSVVDVGRVTSKGGIPPGFLERMRQAEPSGQDGNVAVDAGALNAQAAVKGLLPGAAAPPEGAASEGAAAAAAVAAPLPAQSPALVARPRRGRVTKQQRIAWAFRCALARAVLDAQRLARGRRQVSKVDSAGPAEWQGDPTTVAELARAAAGRRPAAAGQGAAAAAGGRRPGAPRALPSTVRLNEPCLDRGALDTVGFLDHLRRLSWYRDQVVHCEWVPARRASFAEPSGGLSGALAAALAAQGVTRLFSHQAHAVDLLRQGQHTVIATSTASGKSLCYNVPILEAIAADPSATAIYMFPTKALAQDQLRALRTLCQRVFGDAAPAVEVYDGDTPKSERGPIRDRARLLITNPDMLHMSILPVHGQFESLLRGLRYVVLDEGHAYKGVFGAHSAMVVRRLRRLCARLYGSNPTFAVTTATVANPEEHAARLLGSQEVHGTQLQEKAGMTEAEWLAAVAIGRKRGLADEDVGPRPVPGARVQHDSGSSPSAQAGPSATKSDLASTPQGTSGRQGPRGEPVRPLRIRSGGGLRASMQRLAGSADPASRRQLRGRGVVLEGGAGDDRAHLPTSQDWKHHTLAQTRARHGAAGVLQENRRGSPIMELSCLLAEAVQHGLRTLAFCMTRKVCELVTAYVREILQHTAPGLEESIAVYRAGY
ncbi:hypothetical protein APUTEX25_000795, partial [Auxenochlorella protothecoides]